jgi:DNA repair exonuclease SbcCD nuclease subunit
MPKLIHISDLHIGKPFTAFGEKGRFLREAQLETFKKIIELGQKEKVAGILISGDLFDSNDVGKILEEVQNLIKESGLKFYILPGAGEKGVSGHDALVPGSLYYRENWKDISNAFIFRKEEGEVFYDAENGIAFYGKPTRYGESPIPVLEKLRDAKYHIALAHGSIAFREEIKDYPINENEIENSEYHYIALGHWHTFGDYTKGKTRACYPGSAEILERDREGRGTALLITLADEDVSINSVEVGKFFWTAYEIDISIDENEAFDRIRNNFNEPSNTILTLRLKGSAPFQKLDRFKSILLHTLSEFFWVNIDDGDVRPEIDLSQYPENTVIGQFIKIMNKKMNNPEGDNPEVLKEALRIGVGLLTGELDKKSISLEDILR